MAYDLQEQESIDQMKAWWERWGTPVTSVVCVLCLGFAGWNGWNWYQRNQAGKAAVIYASLQNAAAAGDVKNVQSLSSGLIGEYGTTLFAPLGALSAARVAAENGSYEEAKSKLNWVIEKSGRPEYDTVARIRLAGILFDEGKLDEALAALEKAKPVERQKALVLDRQGDVWAAKGDAGKAREAWKQAAAELKADDPLGRVLELKLASLPAEG